MNPSRAQSEPAPEIVVYGPGEAPFVEKVVRALALKKLPHRVVEPESPEDYRRWNPETGLLPVMQLGDTRIHDSGRILDELDRRFPQPPLVSRDAHVAAQQRRLEHWAEETFFYYWVNWLRARVADGNDVGGAGTQKGPLARLGLLRRFTEGGYGAIRGADEEEGLGREFQARVVDIETFLGQRPYFYADRISRADLAVYSFLRTLARDVVPGGRKLLDRHPKLLEFMRRVEQETGRRPA